jgi:hypothetical protein
MSWTQISFPLTHDRSGTASIEVPFLGVPNLLQPAILECSVMRMVGMQVSFWNEEVPIEMVQCISSGSRGYDSAVKIIIEVKRSTADNGRWQLLTEMVTIQQVCRISMVIIKD